MSESTPDQAEALSFLRRFAVIALLGLVGVVALLPGVLASLRELGQSSAVTSELSVPFLALLSLLNPAFLVIAASAVGALVAPRLRLRSRLAEWAATRTSISGSLGRELGVGALTGAVAGLVLLGLNALSGSPFGSGAGALNAGSDGTVVPLLADVLYGSLGEEIIARWGLLTLLAWAFTGFRSGERPGSGRLWLATVLAAVLFALFQLPASLGAAPLTTQLIVSAVALNGLVGVLYGWLYWKFSLEAAMASHASTLLVTYLVASILT